MPTEITEETTIGQLAIELAKNGVQICQLSIMPSGNRRCDLADHAWARGHGEGATAADAIDNALASLREQLAILAGKPTQPVSLDK